MAASATTKLPFTFNFSTTIAPTSLKPKPHLTFPPLITKKFIKIHFKTSRNSIDVSKEENPTSNQEALTEIREDEVLEVFDKRREEEKFAVLNTGVHECRSCGYLYDEVKGDPSYPIPPGLPFDKLPDDWRCATCGASKSFFQNKSVEIAGFAQNQQFGLGGNTLTSGQKALLIYGGLLLGFVFFLSGYFLQ